MDTIKRFFKTPPFNGAAVDFFVWRQREADDERLTYRKDWYNAMPGEYVLTDDLWVGELVHRKFIAAYKGHDSWRLSFSFAVRIVRLHKGTGFIVGTPTLKYEPYRLKGAGYGMLKARRWDEAEAIKKRGKALVEAHARMSIAKQGKRLTANDWDTVGKLSYPKDKIPRASARRSMRSPLFQELSRERVDQILDESGINMTAITQGYQNAWRIAAEQGDTGNMIKAIDRLSELKQKFSDLHGYRDQPYTQIEVTEEREMKSLRPPPPKIVEAVPASTDSNIDESS